MLKKIFGILFGVCLCSAQAMAAATCSDQAVIDSFKEIYVCQFLISCSALGIPSKEFMSVSNDELKRRIYSAPIFSEGVQEVRKGAKNEAGQLYSVTYEKILFNYAMSPRNVIRSVNAVATDYNKDSKRYVCQANIEFDMDSLRNVVMGKTLDSSLKDQTSLLIAGSIEGNKVTEINYLLNAMAAQTNINLSMFSRAVQYTVHPKDPNAWFGSDFIVNFNQESAWTR